MTTYLENYLNSVNTLPEELKRNLKLMRDLDERSQAINFKAEHQRNVKRKLSQQDLAKLQEELQQAVEFGEEKIKIAAQCYDVVDKHIRRLDLDLKKFEKELEAERKEQEMQAKQVLKAKGKQQQKVAPSRTTRKSTSHPDDSLKEPGTLLVDPQSAADWKDLDMPIDPNEPLYCKCQRVSFGEMVGCDNENCPIEWYHFDCVGLTEAPKGKWYCEHCRGSK